MKISPDTRYLDKEVSPEDVKELEGSQEAVEDVVGGEHLKILNIF